MATLNIVNPRASGAINLESPAVRVTAALNELIVDGVRRILVIKIDQSSGQIEEAVCAAREAAGVGVDVMLTTWRNNDFEGEDLIRFDPDALVVCTDVSKDEILSRLNRLDWLRLPKVITFGVAHQESISRSVEEIEQIGGEKSHATGYPFAKAHIFEILRSLRERHCSGWVVELGVFRGGTLLMMNQILKKLSFDGPQLVGFDTFDGFPPRRCLLDLFAMEEFVNRDFDGTAQRLGAEGIRLVRGDIVETASWIDGKKLLLTFVDTDNYSPVAAALPFCWKGTVTGGAVVFDHYYTKELFLDTIGERVAAWEFFRDRTDYLHLSGTGVFIKI